MFDKARAETLRDLHDTRLFRMHQPRRVGGSELDFAKKTEHLQFNAAPRIEAEDTDFGFHYVAMRPVSENPADGTMARIASSTAGVSACVAAA